MTSSKDFVKLQNSRSNSFSLGQSFFLSLAISALLTSKLKRTQEKGVTADLRDDCGWKGARMAELPRASKDLNPALLLCKQLDLLTALVVCCGST